MRLALATTSRFHFCDLVRELNAVGIDATLYSFVPPWVARKFGVPRKNLRWIGPVAASLYAKLWMTKSTVKRKQLQISINNCLDTAVAKQLEPCDVFIGMSGMCNRAAEIARSKFSAQVRIQRCSRHILSQQAILRAYPASEQVSKDEVERELTDYDLADMIDVPATHCIESFTERDFPREKLFCNQFGVNLQSFHATVSPAGPPTFVMVGTWCLRKGCDLLFEAWKSFPNTRLLHVGNVGDLAIPSHPNFEHIPAVRQSDLQRYYSRSHIMVLASREEGLAFVQPQALACGLQLVCSDRTGGADLRGFVSKPESIHEFPTDDQQALIRKMELALQNIEPQSSSRDKLGGKGKSMLTWSAYRDRYLESILEYAT